jgi:hypothetical protein
MAARGRRRREAIVPRRDQRGGRRCLIPGAAETVDGNAVSRESPRLSQLERAADVAPRLAAANHTRLPSTSHRCGLPMPARSARPPSTCGRVVWTKSEVTVPSGRISAAVPSAQRRYRNEAEAVARRERAASSRLTTGKSGAGKQAGSASMRSGPGGSSSTAARSLLRGTSRTDLDALGRIAGHQFVHAVPAGRRREPHCHSTDVLQMQQR